MTSKRTIWTLPANWTMTFLAGWRTLEATLNPAFVFQLVCSKCHKRDVAVVHSAKRDSKLIGLECKVCGQTIKFEAPLDSEAADFPERLQKRAASTLEPPSGAKLKTDNMVLEMVTEVLFEEQP